MGQALDVRRMSTDQSTENRSMIVQAWQSNHIVEPIKPVLRRRLVVKACESTRVARVISPLLHGSFLVTTRSLHGKLCHQYHRMPSYGGLTPRILLLSVRTSLSKSKQRPKRRDHRQHRIWSILMRFVWLLRTVKPRQMWVRDRLLPLRAKNNIPLALHMAPMTHTYPLDLSSTAHKPLRLARP